MIRTASGREIRHRGRPLPRGSLISAHPRGTEADSVGPPGAAPVHPTYCPHHPLDPLVRRVRAKPGRPASPRARPSRPGSSRAPYPRPATPGPSAWVWRRLLPTLPAHPSRRRERRRSRSRARSTRPVPPASPPGPTGAGRLGRARGSLRTSASPARRWLR